MKDILLSLLKRNGIIIVIYAAAMTVLALMPQYGAAAIWVMLFLMLGLIWANCILVNHMSRLLAALATAVISLVLGGAIVLLTVQIQHLFKG